MLLTKYNVDLVEYAVCHPMLLHVIDYAADFVWDSYHKVLCVTEIVRTDEEQRALYPDDPDKVSVHQSKPLCRGIDARSKNLIDGEVSGLIASVNSKFDYGKINPKTNKPYQCCVYHKIERDKSFSVQEYHFHFQVRPGDETKVRY